MAVDLRVVMRHHHYAVHLGIGGDAQELGDAAAARAVELHVADAALVDEVADRPAVQLALAAGEVDMGALRQPPEPAHPVVPVQRLLEPEAEIGRASCRSRGCQYV